MSEVEAEVPETGPIGVDDVLQAIQQKNIGRAKSAFQDVMSQKRSRSLIKSSTPKQTSHLLLQRLLQQTPKSPKSPKRNFLSRMK